MSGGGLVFEGVEKAFGAQRVLKGFTAALPLTGVSFVVGESGSGKSVLCRVGMGLLKPDAGGVRLAGHDVAALPERALAPLRARVPYLVQRPALLDWLTLEENVRLAAPKATAARDASAALARLGLEGVAGKLPRQVGPGVQKRAAIARALVLAPTCLILDEPTTGLDREAAEQVLSALEQLRGEGLGAIVVSHDYDALARLADRVLEVREGVAGYQGEAQGFLDRARQR